MEEVSAIILAAGEGKRMKSKKSKVLHEVCGKPIIRWVLDAVKQSGIKHSVIVVGHQADKIKAYMEGEAEFALQEEQLGTGHAVIKAEALVKGKQEYVIILSGDAPLIKTETIKNALECHIKESNVATILTANLDDATGYGRIIRNDEGKVIKIVEDKDASDDEKLVKEINSGIYCFTTKYLYESLAKINNSNSQKEYYLTDTIEILLNDSLKVGAVRVKDSSELLGINNRIQLAQAEKIMRKRIVDYHMENGVTIINPEDTYINADVSIGTDTIIYPGCIIEGLSKLGVETIIGPNSHIINSVIGDNVRIQNSVLLNSHIDRNAQIGPFAYLRPDSIIGKEVKIGNFVEIKNARVGDGTKVPHLTYIGDADLANNINIGCGCITVNYDGEEKHKTIIKNNAFIGCNSNLVSPVIINEDTFIAAGSTITEDVPKGSMAIARSRQTIKEGWVKKRRG